jgi:hypothetical protein
VGCLLVGIRSRDLTGFYWVDEFLHCREVVCVCVGTVPQITPCWTIL